MKEQLTQINRSITGEGVRESLKLLQGIADFDIKELPTGTKVFDWEVPKEWNIESARLEDKHGVVADLKDTNLRVVGYSQPVNKDLNYEELLPHVHSEPTKPTAIPYRTSYYKPDWGFCLTDKEKKGLDKNSPYHAEINSTLEKGSMTYGEYIIHGNSGKEFLIATYSCHPSMYNDNISGMLVWAKLLSEMQNTKTNHTYHFFIGPETLGVISLLARKNEEKKRGGKGTFDGAVVINCVGRNEDFVLKRSSMGDSEMDKVARQTFKEMGINHTEVPFSVNGSDERQLQSPAFRIPTINITRGEYYGSDWYHSSKDVYRDKLSFLSLGDGQINASVEVYHNILMNLDRNSKIYSLSPHCEPMLGKRNLYPTTSGNNEKDNSATIAKWIMHESGNSLIDIAKNTGFSMKEIREVYDRLKEGGLIK